MSHVFTRTRHSPPDVAFKKLENEALESVNPIVEYAPFTTVDTGVKKYPAPVTLAGLDKALGSRITRLLLNTDPESTLHVGAQVLEDHSKGSPSKKDKDLQANLLVNILKEVSDVSSPYPSERYSICTDLLRRCSLDTSFKQQVSQVLFEKDAINSSQLVVLEHQ